MGRRYYFYCNFFETLCTLYADGKIDTGFSMIATYNTPEEKFFTHLAFGNYNKENRLQYISHFELEHDVLNRYKEYINYVDELVQPEIKERNLELEEITNSIDEAAKKRAEETIREVRSAAAAAGVNVGGTYKKTRRKQRKLQNISKKRRIHFIKK